MTRMLFETDIRTTSRWLGHLRTPEQIRKFKLATYNHDAAKISIALDDRWWREAFTRAAKDVKLTFDSEEITFADYFAVSAIEPEPYTRVYNKIHKERFEAIPIGTVIRMELVLVQDHTPDELTRLVNHVGKFYGLSPWGNKFRYGRFKIVPSQ